MIDFRGEVIVNYLSTGQEYAVYFTDGEIFFDALNAKVNVAGVRFPKGDPDDTSKSLSQKWLLSPEAANRTVHHTTKQGIRMILHLSVSRLFKTNDLALRYNRLHHNVFTDTMQVGTVSRRMNRCAQVYSAEFVWSMAHLMKKKGDAHETLPLLFKRDCVPPKMVIDVSK